MPSQHLAVKEEGFNDNKPPMLVGAQRSGSHQTLGSDCVSELPTAFSRVYALAVCKDD